MRIESERVTIPVGDRVMGGYLARPLPDEPRQFPGVVLFMEIFGLNPHIRSVVDRLAAEGYVVVAPDYFHRVAPGRELAYDQQGIELGMTLIPTLRREELDADVEAAVAYLRGRADVGERPLGAIGFCVGGHAAYLAATSGHFAATASFYGGGIATSGFGEGQRTLDATPDIRGKLVCFFGGDDHAISPAQVETIKRALYSGSVRSEVFVYPGAGHGFFCDARGSHHFRSADDAWKKVKKLFLDELHGA